MSGRRLVAVLGYSNGSSGVLHPVCAERLATAAAETVPGDAVLLSGSAAETELMAAAWAERSGTPLVDGRARSTNGNAVGVAAAARALAAREVVLVTSGWHGRRAAALLRSSLRGSDCRVTLAATGERGTIGARARELACWPLVPLQAARARRGSDPRGPTPADAVRLGRFGGINRAGGPHDAAHPDSDRWTTGLREG